MKKDIFAVMEALREIQKNNATVSKRTINPEYFGTSKSLYNTSLALLTGRQLKEEVENKNKDEDDDAVNSSKDKNEKENENVKINPELKDEKDMNDDVEDEDWNDEDENWEDEDEEEKEDTEEDENESKKDNEEDEKDKEKKNKNVEESIHKNYPVIYEKVNAQLFTKEEIKKIKNILKGRN